MTWIKFIENDLENIKINLVINNTVKGLLSPRGAYLILDLPEGGLNRAGLIHKIKRKGYIW